jgi:epoxyqueuosine reductase QueG|tara:strand:- start:166 stop:501 length:336 start_codon:yes stop_codon:yes gene_type:complete
MTKPKWEEVISQIKKSEDFRQAIVHSLWPELKAEINFALNMVKEENARLVKALESAKEVIEWYANQETYEEKHSDIALEYGPNEYVVNHKCYLEIAKDHGAKAREWLAEFK